MFPWCNNLEMAYEYPVIYFSLQGPGSWRSCQLTVLSKLLVSNDVPSSQFWLQNVRRNRITDLKAVYINYRTVTKKTKFRKPLWKKTKTKKHGESTGSYANTLEKWYNLKMALEVVWIFQSCEIMWNTQPSAFTYLRQIVVVKY